MPTPLENRDPALQVAAKGEARFGVLHAIAPAPYGGAETAVLGLTSRLGGRLDVLLAVLADARSGPFIASAERAGLAVEVLDSAARNYLRDWTHLRRLIRQHGIHLLHTHGYRADAVGLLAARAESIPSVATAHGFTGGTLRNRINQFVGVQALRRAQAVIAVSAPLGATLRRQGVRGERIHVIPNAWAPPSRESLPRAEARRLLGLPESGTLVGWVGRFSVEKGPDLAVEAIRGLAAGIELVMLGDGAERARVVQQAAAYGISNRVRMLGAIANVWAILPAFDLLLLSSRTEGTPMILLEAMHAGVPIVASPVGGVPALLGPDSAWLAEGASAPELQAALREALADPIGSQSRAAGARALLLERDLVDEWVERHVVLYGQLVGSGGR